MQQGNDVSARSCQCIASTKRSDLFQEIKLKSPSDSECSKQKLIYFFTKNQTFVRTKKSKEIFTYFSDNSTYLFHVIPP